MTSPHFLQPKKILKLLKVAHPQFLNNLFLDPYRGCEFGCVYCYGIKENQIDSGSGPTPYRVSIKTSTAFCLKKEIPAAQQHSDSGKIELNPSGQTNFSLGIGFESDPYQPIEEQFQLTARSLEIVKEAACPVQILTKSELVLRDRKILAELSQAGLAIVSISLFTIEEELAKIFEPRAPQPAKRLELISKLRDANIVCGAMLMPIFPYLSDDEERLEEVFFKLQAHGALYCVPGILTLESPQVKKRVSQILKERFPKLTELYEALYDKLGHPALNYCERIRGILNRCSEKYQIPTVLPVEGLKEKSSLIVKTV